MHSPPGSTAGSPVQEQSDCSVQPSQTCSQWYLDAAPDGWVDVFEFDADTGDVIDESSAIFCPSDVSSLIYSLSISICFRACDGRREVEDALPRYAASGQRIVLLAADGVASRSIGRAVGCTTGTASKWRVRYARKRLAGLGETGDGLTLYASMVLQPPFLQELMDYPVSTAGIVMGPRGIGTMISMLAVGRMVGHIRHPPVARCRSCRHGVVVLRDDRLRLRTCRRRRSSVSDPFRAPGSGVSDRLCVGDPWVT